MSNNSPMPPPPIGGGRLYEPLKRAMDIAIALVVLILLLPLWLLIALAIKLTSSGPVLFAGRAVGKGGREFTYYKFRSMYAEADDTVHRVFLENYVLGDRPYATVQNPKNGEERKIYKVINDPRVTPVGKALRRFSLDEVPQLVNVLRGEMSIVGPRPPVAYEYSLYDERAKGRLLVRPGITGLAQVRGRNRLSFREMVQLDLEYIEKRSLWLDLKIMLLTFPAMLRGV